MVIDNTMKTNSKFRQNNINILSIQTVTNNNKLTLHIFYDFITCLSVNNKYTEYSYSIYSDS